jgi:hypothetical protein
MHLDDTIIKKHEKITGVKTTTTTTMMKTYLLFKNAN